jgi:TRAP-type C4-dicarboxylate transport system substrate-binding protein
VLVSTASEAKVLKLATIAPEGSGWMKIMRNGAAEIKERTQGRVVIKFYTGGVMGNDRSVLRKIRVRQLNGGAFTGGSLAEVYPDLRLYSLPMVFQSFDELDYVRSRMDEILLNGLNEAGFVSFGFAEGGFAQVMSNVPIRTLEDLKGKKIWIPEGDPVGYAVMKSLGLAPVTLPVTDVMTGLEAGLIEVVATSAIGAITFQWHTKLKYITETRLSYIFATLVVDRKVFSKLKPMDQKVVREVMGRTYTYLNRQNRKDCLAAEKALIAQGLVAVRQNDDQLNEWRLRAWPSIERLLKENAVSKDLYQRMQSYIEAFRKQKGSDQTTTAK